MNVEQGVLPIGEDPAPAPKRGWVPFRVIDTSALGGPDGWLEDKPDNVCVVGGCWNEVDLVRRRAKKVACDRCDRSPR